MQKLNIYIVIGKKIKVKSCVIKANKDFRGPDKVSLWIKLLHVYAHFSTNTYSVAPAVILMGTHNIHFHGEIKLCI